MGARMIPVRNIETGQETKVGESAFPYFAGTFERLDQPAADPVDDTPSKPDKSAAKRPATTESKE
ncbi:hypothetical protein AB0L53_54710 [Nonomuraea sp. NPDC052129]|uniref:hypothetical protein n=1 Tax=Nonomuraea sp. NPDC052129 TaxID=3154651 RepID=UPI00343BABB1